MGFANVVCFFLLPRPSCVTAHRINSDKMVINISPPLLKRREDAGAPVPGSKGGHCQTGHLASFFIFFFIFFFFTGRKCVFQSANLVVFRKKMHVSVLSLSQLFMKDYKNDWFLFGQKLYFHGHFSVSFIFLFIYHRKWGMWAGTPKNQYSQMVYENGEPCWQGGSRSTTVSVPHRTTYRTHTHTHTHTHT